MTSTIKLGDLEVNRLGFGAMRLPGKDIWGEPDDRERAKSVVRRAIELGINFIDTSWYYGPFTANRIIADAIHPYPRDLVIATKLGGMRKPDKGWGPFARPEQLREGLEHDLRDLKLERIDIVHFRFIEMAGVPFMESFDALVAEVAKGRIRHLALSNVSAKYIEMALARAPIVAVQNMYNLGGGGGPAAKMAHAEVEDPEGVIALCEKHKLAYLPFFPLAVGKHDALAPGLEGVAKKHGATTAQIAIAWLLARSPMMLPIPGTSSPAHLEENWAARNIKLDADDLAALRSQ